MVGELKTQIMEYIKSSSIIPMIIDLIYTIMFYFKLKNLPQFINSRYKYISYIFYRLNLPPNGR
jgi:hypothetical protein